MDEFLQLITEAMDAIANADTAMESIASVFTSIVIILEGIVSIFGVGIFLLSLLVSAVVAVILYFLRAIPLCAIAKKAKCKQRWMVWIPLFQELFCLYVLSKIPGQKDFLLFNGKMKIKQSHLVMPVYLLVHFFGSAIVSVLIIIVNFVPVLGQIAGAFITLLYLLPPIVKAVIEYVYLRDTLAVFKKNENDNQAHAFIVVLLDTLVTRGLARIFYLCSMMRLDPLPAPTENTETPYVHIPDEVF